jgi:hypothetical protein
MPGCAPAAAAAHCNTTLTLAVTTDAWPAESSYELDSDDACPPLSEAKGGDPPRVIGCFLFCLANRKHIVRCRFTFCFLFLLLKS